MYSSIPPYDSEVSEAEVDFHERYATDPRFRAEVDNPPEWWMIQHD